MVSSRGYTSLPTIQDTNTNSSFDLSASTPSPTPTSPVSPPQVPPQRNTRNTSNNLNESFEIDDEFDTNRQISNPFADPADPNSRSHQPQHQHSNSNLNPDSTNNHFSDIEIDQELESIANQTTRSSLKNAFMLQMNSIVGAGIVGIPRAFKNSGLLTGIILLALLAILNDWTLRLIILNTKLSGAKTYTGVVTHNFGDWGKVVILLAQGLFALGGNIGFSVIIGDSIPHVLRSLFHEAVENHQFVDFILSRNFLIFFCVMGISYPLSLNRNIGKLAKASGFALIGMTIIILIVVIRGPMMNSEIKGHISGHEWFISPNIFQSISVISFALVCHHNTTFIYDSIRKPTLDRFDTVTHLSCLISTAVCALMGISGYLNFGSKTKGNVLNNFPSGDWVANVARFCFGMNMLTTFPLELFVIREVVKDLIIIYKKRQHHDETYTIDQLSTTQHVVITTILSIIPMVVALFTCNLGAVLELVGATSASTIAYILPPLCYIKMTWRTKTMFQRILPFACVAFGFMVMFLSSAQTIISALKNTDDGHCVE
ncbi:unnamed protein product [Ambrosiozyma monospora]|uniref:Unnamed protein product n=1 Tax=Ambrosiozyma monospora TaxID=43982 RepID=A0A9W6YRB6_AMBMO|nr:unnamed protein product [Ambrosiozyma monospora]